MKSSNMKINKSLYNSINSYTKKIDESDVGAECKQLRSERKKPKKHRKQFEDFLILKQKWQHDM